MSKLILDGDTLAKFLGFKEHVEVCDKTGQVIGDFHPRVAPSGYQNVEVPFTEEELDRYEQEPGGRSLAEILRDLERQA